jgi:hypothetical protein
MLHDRRLRVMWLTMALLQNVQLDQSDVIAQSLNEPCWSMLNTRLNLHSEAFWGSRLRGAGVGPQ